MKRITNRPPAYAALAAAATMLLAAGSDACREAQAQAQPPQRLQWSFAGLFGKFDQGQLQRGFKIYREVCAACHSMALVSIGTLADASGPGYSRGQVASLANEYMIADVDEQGEAAERQGRPADRFPSPFPNEAAAMAANGGIAPPDLSTLAKARNMSAGLPWSALDVFTQYQEQGPDYIAAVLKGYATPPRTFTVPPGGYYNTAFPGRVIAMPPPLQAGQVAYHDEAPQTLDQYAKDVAAFLMWAAEPHLVDRKRIGFQAVPVLLLLAGLLYLTKRKVWAAIP